MKTKLYIFWSTDRSRRDSILLLTFLFYQISADTNTLIHFFLTQDLLRTDTEPTDQPDSARRQKACDTENLSNYNKLAKTGGHKGMLLITS